MKKLLTLLLAAGLMLGGASAAKAVDIKISGEWDFTAQWTNLAMSKQSESKDQHSAFYQRLLTQIDIIASEAVSGVVLFEIGDTLWGRSAAATGDEAGGGLGADGINIKVKSAFLDWIVPHTELQIRMGLQEVVLPGLDESSQVFADDVAGIVMNYAFNDNVSATAWWVRPFSDNNANFATTGNHLSNRSFNEMDMFGVSVPMTFEGVDATPWGMYAAIGRDIFADGYEGATSDTHYRQMLPRWIDTADPDFRASDGQGSGYWLGLTGMVSLWDPFRFGWDLNYGSVDLGHTVFNGGQIDLERSGWYLALLAEYEFENVTPGLVFWYASGDDSDAADGSEAMPSIHAASPFTSFGQDGAGLNFAGTAFQSGLAGTWGFVFRLNDISFIEDLTHTFQVAYYRGTNDDDMAFGKGGPVASPWANADFGGDTYTYMTTKDSAWEVNFSSEYKIYENLKCGLELGYIRLDLSDSAWGRDIADSTDDAWKIGMGLQYSF